MVVVVDNLAVEGAAVHLVALVLVLVVVVVVVELPVAEGTDAGYWTASDLPPRDLGGDRDDFDVFLPLPERIDADVLPEKPYWLNAL